MSIYDYTRNPSPSGFRGYRVSVQFNGIPHQRYFKPDQSKAAEAYHSDLLGQKDRHMAKVRKARRAKPQKRNYKAECYNGPRRTEIPGLRICFQTQYKSNPTRYYPALLVSATHHETGKRVLTSRNVNPGNDLREKWRELCRIMADAKGLVRVPSHWYKAEPTPAQFEELRQFEIEQGRDIPKTVIAHLE